MHILLVTHFFPPTHNAGTENYTLGLAQALKNRGHEILVLCAEDWESGRRYWNGVSRDIYCGLPVYRIHLNWKKAANPNRVLYDSPLVEKWFNNFLAKKNIDCIHVTSTYSLGIGILRSAQQAGIPLVLTLMDFWFLCPRTILMQTDSELCRVRTSAWECEKCLLSASSFYMKTKCVIPDKLQSFFWRLISRLPVVRGIRGARGMAINIDNRRLLMKHVLQIPDMILSHSFFVKNVFEQAGMARCIVKLTNGHDLNWLQNYKPGNRSNCLRFGYMGQIKSMKGIHILLEAFLKANTPPRAYLDIWGDTEADPKYVRMIRELVSNSDFIKIRGRFQHENLAKVLSGIDVLIVPSLWYENAPLVIQEAFAAQIPVIATDLGGMSETVTHEINGLLFARGDSNDLSHQIRRILEEPELMKKLKVGIPHVKTFQEEALELELIYKDLANRRTLKVDGVRQ